MHFRRVAVYMDPDAAKIACEIIARSHYLSALKWAAGSHVMLIIGTSAVKSPASELPVMSKSRGAKLIEINLERTGLTNSITDVFIPGRAEGCPAGVVESR